MFKSAESFANQWTDYWKKAERGEIERLGSIFVHNEKSRKHVFSWYKRLGREILTNFYNIHIGNRQHLERMRMKTLGEEYHDLKVKERLEKLRTMELNPELNLFPIIERSFIINFNGFDLKGKIDRIDGYVDDKGDVIPYNVDYKTSKKCPDKNDLLFLNDPSNQFTIYQLAVDELLPFSKTPESFFYHLRSGLLVPKIVTEDHIQYLAEDLETIKPLLIDITKARKILKEVEKKENKILGKNKDQSGLFGTPELTGIKEEDIKWAKDYLSPENFPMTTGNHCYYCDYYNTCLKEMQEKIEHDDVFDSENLKRAWDKPIQQLEDDIEIYWEDDEYEDINLD